MPDDPSPFAFSQIQPSGTSVEGPLMGGDTAQEDVRVLQEQLAKMRQTGVQLAEKQKMSEDPSAGLESMTVNKDGMMSAKFHKSVYEGLMRDHQELNQIRGSFHQEAERLKAQEERVRNQSPWITLATTLSANMAQQKNMPGWVQATGRTAAQLNPSADQIRDQRLGVMQEQAKLAEKQGEMQMGLMREDRLASYEDATLGMENKKFARQLVQDKLHAEEKVHERFDDLATKGLFNPKTFATQLKAANPDISDEEIAGLVKGKQELSAQSNEMRTTLGTAKFNEFKKEQDVKYQNEVRLAALDHKNKMEELIVKNRGTINPKTGKPFTQYELKEVAEMETTSILVDNLARDLDEHPDLFGPMPQTRAKTWVESFFDEGVSRVRADYDHALPIMVKLLQEGTRGYANNQRQWVESKVPKTTDTPERLKGKLAFLRGFLDARQKGLDKMFVMENMAREQQQKGQSPYPASSHAPTQDSGDVWTPEKVKALRGGE